MLLLRSLLAVVILTLSVSEAYAVITPLFRTGDEGSIGEIDSNVKVNGFPASIVRPVSAEKVGGNAWAVPLEDSQWVSLFDDRGDAADSDPGNFVYAFEFIIPPGNSRQSQ